MTLENRVFARHAAVSANELQEMRELSQNEIDKISGAEMNSLLGTNVFTPNCNGCGGGQFDTLDA